jgi:hypothetical protein
MLNFNPMSSSIFFAPYFVPHHFSDQQHPVELHNKIVAETFLQVSDFSSKRA